MLTMEGLQKQICNQVVIKIKLKFYYFLQSFKAHKIEIHRYFNLIALNAERVVTKLFQFARLQMLQCALKILRDNPFP